MISIGISTVDELLRLGGKIADLVTILLSRKASKEEQKQLQATLEQFNDIRQTHAQFDALLREYNTKLGQAPLQNGVQLLFPLCTHRGFKEAEQIYAAMQQQQVSYQELVDFVLLSVKLFDQSVKVTGLASTVVTDQRWADAYTYERWITAYQTGDKRELEVVNLYQVVWQDDSWKVNTSRVFS
jgi:hypothetical protein